MNLTIKEAKIYIPVQAMCEEHKRLPYLTILFNSTDSYSQ